MSDDLFLNVYRSLILYDTGLFSLSHVTCNVILLSECFQYITSMLLKFDKYKNGAFTAQMYNLQLKI